MTYRFICPRCGATHELDMPISDYKPGGHYCDCGEELIRDPKSFCTSYSTKTSGFYADYPSN